MIEGSQGIRYHGLHPCRYLRGGVFGESDGRKRGPHEARRATDHRARPSGRRRSLRTRHSSRPPGENPGEHEWATRAGGGTVLYAPSLLRWTAIQQRPAAVNPKALTDVRVRRALAHGMDGEAATEVTTGGRGFATYTMTSRESPRFARLASVLPPRLYDPRKVQQHFEEAGFSRGPDGFFAAGGEPFKLEVGTDGSAVTEQENAVYVDSLRRAGVDAFSYVIPVVQLHDLEARMRRPGLMNGGLGGRRSVYSSDRRSLDRRIGGRATTEAAG